MASLLHNCLGPCDSPIRYNMVAEHARCAMSNIKVNTISGTVNCTGTTETNDRRWRMQDGDPRARGVAEVCSGWQAGWLRDVRDEDLGRRPFVP